MHEKGVAHRDLKLDNLIINDISKEMKIIDFGFSVGTEKKQR